MKRIIVVGSSGHASSVIDVVKQDRECHIVGLLDRFKAKGLQHSGYEVLGSEEDIRRLSQDHNISGVVVAIGDNWGRSQSVGLLRAQVQELVFPVVIHPSAVVSGSATIGCGTVVMAGAVINANCRLGEFCIINTKASLDHNCVVEDFGSLAPGVTVGGCVAIGAFTAVGLGANIVHKRRIGRHTVLGAGATLLTDLPENVIAYGTPAKVIRQREAGEPYL